VAYGLQTNLEHPDYRGIINLCHVVDGGVRFTQASPRPEQVFNLDGYLRYLAVISRT